MNFYVRAVVSYVITACECMHLVRCGHFQSHDKDGSHSSGSAIPMLHVNLMVLSFIELVLWVIKVYIEGIGIFYLFLLLRLMTFMCKLDVYSLEIHQMYKYMYEFPMSRLLKVIV